MLTVITELHAIAQSGLSYTTNPFDRERYERIIQLCATLLGRENTALLHAQTPDATYHTLHTLLVQEQGYMTPKVDVRGAVFRDGRILLVQEIRDGCWSLPGGWADVNHSPAENVLKEIAEEAGYLCCVQKCIAIYDKHKRNPPAKWPPIYKVFFLCQIQSAVLPTAALEIQAIDFFSPDALPPLSLGRVTAEQIATCVRHAKQPELPTEFD